MKKTINVGIASRIFIIDEDAYSRLKSYLKSFRCSHQQWLDAPRSNGRSWRRPHWQEIIPTKSSPQKFSSFFAAIFIEKVILELGMPDGSTAESFNFSTQHTCAHGKL